MLESAQRATLGGGCFWCLEPVFASLRGVISVLPGYAGGHVPHPSYEEVCTGTTGHAETVQITFDAAQISYRNLLQIFFAVHDPTTRDRQGGDVGRQYRSVIFSHTPEQAQIAREVIADLEPEDTWEGSQVVTEVLPLSAFYEAEKHHQDYFNRNPERSYCHVVIAPKMAKFRKRFARDLSAPVSP